MARVTPPFFFPCSEVPEHLIANPITWERPVAYYVYDAHLFFGKWDGVPVVIYPGLPGLSA